MLRLPPFSYRRAESLDEAVKVLAGEGESARLVAGGTDLWPNMKRRHQHAETVVSLMGIPGLSGIDSGNNGEELRIGATTLLSTVASDAAVRNRFPALSRAVASISSPPLRNMGTLGGNLCLDTRCTYYNQTEPWRRSIDYCMKETGQICWVAPSSPKCWAHSASDSAPILCALRARARLVSKAGDRVVAVEDLFRNDGIDYLNKRPDEVLADVLVPRSSDSTQCRTSFWKLRRRGTIDFAVLTVAAAVWFDKDERVRDAALFLGSVGSQPLAVPGVVDLLRGARLDSETIGAVAAAARKVATPMDNTDFSTQWRGVMTTRYTEAALREVAGLDPKLSPPRHQMFT